jgi:hypothetical protein
MIAREIIGREKQPDTPRALLADRRDLIWCRGAGEEDGGGVCRRAGRADGDPALVLLRLVRILDEREAEFADVEGKRFVIVADDEGDVGQVGQITLANPITN